MEKSEERGFILAGLILCLLIFLILRISAVTAITQKQTNSTQSIEVFFSPKGGCQDAIIQEINKAKKSIRIQAYSFTNAEIAKALLKAKKRNISVEVILDKSQETARYSSASFFANQNIPLLIDDKHAIAHNKIIIIDSSIVITGSYNFSKAAENRNAENLLIIKGYPALAIKYICNYQKHKRHSQQYESQPNERRKR